MKHNTHDFLNEILLDAIRNNKNIPEIHRFLADQFFSVKNKEEFLIKFSQLLQCTCFFIKSLDLSNDEAMAMFSEAYDEVSLDIIKAKEKAKEFNPLDSFFSKN